MCFGVSQFSILIYILAVLTKLKKLKFFKSINFERIQKSLKYFLWLCCFSLMVCQLTLCTKQYFLFETNYHLKQLIGSKIYLPDFELYYYHQTDFIVLSINKLRKQMNISKTLESLLGYKSNYSNLVDTFRINNKTNYLEKLSKLFANSSMDITTQNQLSIMKKPEKYFRCQINNENCSAIFIKQIHFETTDWSNDTSKQVVFSFNLSKITQKGSVHSVTFQFNTSLQQHFLPSMILSSFVYANKQKRMIKAVINYERMDLVKRNLKKWKQYLLTKVVINEIFVQQMLGLKVLFIDVMFTDFRQKLWKANGNNSELKLKLKIYDKVIYYEEVLQMSFLSGSSPPNS